MVENKGFGIEDVFGLWTALEILKLGKSKNSRWSP